MNQKRNNFKAQNPEWVGGLLDFFGQADLQKAADLYGEMQKPVVKPSELGFTPRVLNYWKQNLKMEISRNERHPFTFYEMVWVRVVQQLMAANVTLFRINELLTQLTKPLSLKGILSKQDKVERLLTESKLSKEQREQLLRLLNVAELAEAPPLEINLLHIVIMECIIKKLPLSLAVFLDGSILVIDNTKGFLYSEADKQKLFFQSYFVISVTGIIREFLASDLSEFILPQVSILPNAESKLFGFVHSGDYETITIHFKDKKIKSVELKKSVDIKTRLVDLLHSGEYGQIVVKKHKGEVVKIESNEKINL